MIELFRNKRVYEPVSADDGFRVLVERLWPRGVTKERAAIHRWCREIAPSPELRTWFGHDPDRWDEFRRRYREELGRQREFVDALVRKSRTGTVTLVYAARDTGQNSAVVLQEFVEEQV